MKAIIHIGLKPGVLDPQGRAISRSLNDLGFDEVVNARQGKVIEIDIKGKDTELAHKRVTNMCEKLLANTVIESYLVEIKK
ncbi:MAG: phosphoribosylformylglycinamidine synthase subunit PurS [Hellea sp.]|jgi:phosphoribosylformylglycinamidine synthase|nr:phosphoribosylformylglycinamidine synthase subunit PurS [Hellea sp.]MBT4996692.1 phosphoribosylformylglycinamidine synthase subunit PurS [Hellea sp.]MBT5836963.1 phosphoribosylformylglycinamidine synthase subunit PurS [Hellea sp.]MBT7397826.1 phosphoribosylformylglycinamidine synthase subunit PurS [Hellea sp.]MDC0422472.1 phosphoribosylformylglycinamidine synthase subunit PurS [Hellea sp.]